jgi:hypothetical protein
MRKTAAMVEWWKEMVERWKMPSLNIKNEETYRMVKDLATLKRISLTAAVTESVRETLQREKAASKRATRMEWLDRVTRETARLMNDGRTSREWMDDLYDEETGLPL